MVKRRNDDEIQLSSLPIKVESQINTIRSERINRAFEWVLEEASAYTDELPKRDGFHKMRLGQKKDKLFWAIKEAHYAREDLKRHTATEDEIRSAEHELKEKL